MPSKAFFFIALLLVACTPEPDPESASVEIRCHPDGSSTIRPMHGNLMMGQRDYGVRDLIVKCQNEQTGEWRQYTMPNDQRFWAQSGAYSVLRGR